MDILAVLFDKDGTLFDFNATWGAWTKAMIMDEAAGDAVILDRLSKVLGYDLENACFLSGSPVIAETTDLIADRIMAVMPDQDRSALVARMIALAQKVSQVPATDLPALMTDLTAYGLTLGVMTNDNVASARVHLQSAGILDAFAMVIGADSGFGAKPAPDPLLAFCGETQVAPGACLMVGDSLHDLQAGAAAGMIPVGVLTGPTPRETLTPYAAVVLDSIADLPGWISSQRAGAGKTR